MNKHISDDELQAELVAADMYQAEILLNDGERNAALWQRIPDTLARFAAHDHAPETLDAATTLREVNRACEALADPVRVLDVYRGITGAHLHRLARDPYASAAAASAHRAVSQYAAALRTVLDVADTLTRALTRHRAELTSAHLHPTGGQH